MKKALKIIGIIVLVAVLLVAALLIVSKITLDNAAKLKSYDFGSVDKVPSFNAVVGDRKVTGVESSSSSNGTSKKTYTYETKSVESDLTKYTTALKDAGWLIAQPAEGNMQKGTMQFGIASADAGKIIVIDLAWDNAKFTVQATKGPGTITMPTVPEVPEVLETPEEPSE